MKKYYPYIFILLAALHFFVLYTYGISTFTTTILFYYCLFRAVKIGILKTGITKNSDVLLQKVKFFFLLILMLEFVLMFVLRFANTATENEKYIYLSIFKRKEQCNLLRNIGFKNTKFTYVDAYEKNSTRISKQPKYSYIHHYNQLGLRGELPSLRKDSNEIRILMLGDSFIEGEGTPEDSTISVLLENKLNQKQSKHRYKVINAGIYGSNTIYEQQLYTNLLQQLKPDLIINAVYSNDIGDIYVMKHNSLPLSEYLDAISHIYRIIHWGLMEFDIYGSGKGNNFTKKTTREIKQLIIQTTGKFEEKLTSENIDLINIYIPSPEEISSKKDYNKVSNSDFFDVNLFDKFIQLQKHESDFIKKYYWNSDVHFRPAGYDLTACILAEKIKEKYD